MKPTKKLKTRRSESFKGTRVSRDGDSKYSLACKALNKEQDIAFAIAAEAEIEEREEEEVKAPCFCNGEFTCFFCY